LHGEGCRTAGVLLADALPSVAIHAGGCWRRKGRTFPPATPPSLPPVASGAGILSLPPPSCSSQLRQADRSQHVFAPVTNTCPSQQQQWWWHQPRIPRYGHGRGCDTTPRAPPSDSRHSRALRPRHGSTGAAGLWDGWLATLQPRDGVGRERGKADPAQQHREAAHAAEPGGGCDAMWHRSVGYHCTSLLRSAGADTLFWKAGLGSGSMRMTTTATPPHAPVHCCIVACAGCNTACFRAVCT